MAKSLKETRGSGTHVTNPKKDNTEKLGSIVSDIKTNDLVWNAKHYYGKIVAIVIENGGYVAYVKFDNNKNAIYRYKIPEDFTNGKVKKCKRK